MTVTVPRVTVRPVAARPVAPAVPAAACLPDPTPVVPAHPTLPHPTLPPGGGWVPASPCTPACLPPAAGGPRVATVRVVARLAALAVLLLAAAVGTSVLSGRTRDGWLRAVVRAALRAVGIRLRVLGAERFAETGVLVVANHLSWIDVLALDAVQPVRLLTKHEVRGWPLVGALAARSGALFLDRAGLRALPTTVADTADALRGGAAVGVFPEGTTWCGAAAGRFRRAAFQAAIDARAPVRPVAVVLRLPDGTPARAAAFVGDQTLWDSLLRVVRLRGLVCELTLLPSILPSETTDRRELARRAGDAIGAVTGTPHGVPHPAAPAYAA